MADDLPALHVDGRQSPPQIALWAAQASTMRTDVRSMLSQYFTQDETPDFYQGLLSGLTAALAISRQGRPPALLEAMMAMTRSHIATGKL